MIRRHIVEGERTSPASARSFNAHLQIDAGMTVAESHDIAVEARRRVMQRHRVLNVMTHVDPWLAN